MKPQLILVLILLSFQTSVSQIKNIKGDTAYWYKINKAAQKAFNFKDLEKSTDEFNFRFSYDGQVIEVSKDSSNVNGRITNYIYHIKKGNGHKTDTLFNKIILSSEKAKNIYNIILNSGILELPSDNKIKKWKPGFDGIEYRIEYSDKENYWQKNYWTPSIQDSIPEALIVLNFVKKLSDSLNLEKTYTTFKNDLPRQGCYNLGGMVNTCYISNTFELGYSGATKLPLGFYTSYSATYIGKAKVNFGTALQYNFSDNKFYYLNFIINKWYIFRRESQSNDFIGYSYQNRRIDINKPDNKFQNHQIKYNLNLNSDFYIGAGVDYLIDKHQKIGSQFYVSRYFSKPSILTDLTSSIFNDQINYKAQIFKSFHPNQKFIVRHIALGMAYEDYMHYQDVCFNVLVAL